MTNFKGWQIRVFFTDVESVDEIAENETELELQRKLFFDAIEHLVFNCNYVPQRGNIVYSAENFSMSVSQIGLNVKSKTIEFYITPIEITN